MPSKCQIIQNMLYICHKQYNLHVHYHARAQQYFVVKFCSLSIDCNLTNLKKCTNPQGNHIKAEIYHRWSHNKHNLRSYMTAPIIRESTYLMIIYANKSAKTCFTSPNICSLIFAYNFRFLLSFGFACERNKRGIRICNNVLFFLFWLDVRSAQMINRIFIVHHFQAALTTLSA